jgi:hypothetical protein
MINHDTKIGRKRMPQQTLKKFATQVDAATLATVRDLAKSEGRLLQSLINEALTDLLEKRRKTAPRASVMAAYQASHENFAPHYKKLAE